MNALREAAQQALEALETYRQMMFAEAGCRWDGGDTAIAALRAALAQQAEPVEPVAHRAFLERILAAMEGVIDVADRKTDEFDALRSCVIDLTVMLHAAPPQQVAQQAEPLNLRDPAVQKRLATQWGYVPAAQAEPVEPFGYWFPDKHPEAVCSGWFVRSPCDGKLDGKPGVNLYTAPQLCPNCASLEAQNTELDDMLVEMKHAVAQAAAVERKACADICDAHASCEGIAQRCAADIRARGQA